MQDICIVVPCFNEERRLPGREILDFLGAHDEAAICFVDDGSSDRTLEVVKAISDRAPHAVLVLSLPENQGKAEAVRQGILHVAATHRFPLIGFWDADLSTPLKEIHPIADVFTEDPGCELAMGSRVRRLGSKIQRSALRHYLGRTFSTIASLLLHLPVYDSQCGAKMMRADVAEVLCAERFLTRWLFDVEMLARLRNHLGRRRVLEAVTEVPLRTWTEVGGSKLRLSHMTKVPVELFRISRHYNRQPRKPAGAAPHVRANVVAPLRGPAVSTLAEGRASSDVVPHL